VQQVRLNESLLGSAVVVALAGPRMELVSDPVAVPWGQVRHAFPFRKMLAEQPLRILVAFPLPRVVGRSEVERGAAADSGGPAGKLDFPGDPAPECALIPRHGGPGPRWDSPAEAAGACSPPSCSGSEGGTSHAMPSAGLTRRLRRRVRRPPCPCRLRSRRRAAFRCRKRPSG